MGKLFLENLSSTHVYACSVCAVHLTSHEEIISKTFYGSHGIAYLFNDVVNVETGVAEDRQMTTGLHTVVDVHCRNCNHVLGWKYEKAYEETQKYKEGKFILEMALVRDLQT